MRYLYAKHPKIAERWSSEHGMSENMPEKMEKKGRKLKDMASGMRKRK